MRSNTIPDGCNEVTISWPFSQTIHDLFLIFLDNRGGNGRGFEDVMRFEKHLSSHELLLDLSPGVYECKFMADGEFVT